MAQLVRILDERKWALRCFYADLVAIAFLIGFAIALVVDSFYVGYHTWPGILDQTGGTAFKRDVAFFRMVLEGIGFALSLGWLIYRIVRSGYKSITQLA